LPAWFTESVGDGLSHVSTDEEADPQGFYCEKCFECEEGAPLETVDGEIPPAGDTLEEDSRTERDWYGYQQTREAACLPWRFTVCAFSGPPHPDGSDSLCRLQRSDGSSESGIPVDIEGRLLVRGQTFGRRCWTR